jgi:hypothetical protein
MPSSSSSLVLDGFFCFSLHTGTVLLGWLGFISSFLSIIGWSLSFNNIDGIIKKLNITDKNPDDWTPDQIDFMRSSAIFIISMLIGFYVIEALASLFLIHGASNNKRLFLGKATFMILIFNHIEFYQIFSSLDAGARSATYLLHDCMAWRWTLLLYIQSDYRILNFHTRFWRNGFK